MSRVILAGSILSAFIGSVVGLSVAFGFGHEGSKIGFTFKALLCIGTLGTFISAFLRRILGTERADGLLVNLIISLISLNLVLLIAEFAVRFVFRDVTTTSDNNSYFARCWKERNVRVNSWGYRDREFSPVKRKLDYRIVVIGDSVTYGQGIDEVERFTNLLERRLNRETRKYEVLGFGRPGAETVDHLKILADQALRIEPDFVLLQWFTNDVEGEDRGDRPLPLRLLPSDFLVSKLSASSALYYLVNQQWVSLQNKLGWLESYEHYMIARFGNPNSASSRAAREALEKFIHICKENGVPFGIVLFSHRNPLLDFLTERVLKQCEQEAITCVDLRTAFAPYKGEQNLWASRLDPHPGSLENRLAADRLMEVFAQVWLGT